MQRHVNKNRQEQMVGNEKKSYIINECNKNCFVFIIYKL